MPSITLNRTAFENYVGKKLPLDTMKDRISYLGTDLEDVTDNEIHVEIFPNRPDMLSVQGFARAFRSFIGTKTGLSEFTVKESGEKVIIDESVKTVRPYTACAIVKGLHFDDERIKEVIAIQEKLHITYGRNRKKVAIGIYPYEKIKTPIHFCAEDPKKIQFHPLESDKEMTAQEILETHSAGKAYGYLLDSCKKYPLFKDANGSILSMPPIINSHTVGKINEKTKDVFIECSGFDFRIMKKCLNMIVTALADMGGAIYSMELDYGKDKYITPDLQPEEMPLDLEYINKLLGLNLNEKKAQQLLEMMGYGYRNKKVLIPSYRADIIHQADLAEDIAIAHGFENFPAIIPKVATVAEEQPIEVFKRNVRESLIGLGFLQASVYMLTNDEFQSTRMNFSKESIKLANSISSDYDTLRSWTLPALMEILAVNKHHEFPQSLFAFGTSFAKDMSTDTHVKETETCALVMSMEQTDYTAIRQVIDYLMRNLDVIGDIAGSIHSSFIDGRTASLKIGKEEIAVFGELHPGVLSNWGLEMPTVGCEINITALFESKKGKRH